MSQGLFVFVRVSVWPRAMGHSVVSQSAEPQRVGVVSCLPWQAGYRCMCLIVNRLGDDMLLSCLSCNQLCRSLRDLSVSNSFVRVSVWSRAAGHSVVSQSAEPQRVGVVSCLPWQAGYRCMCLIVSRLGDDMLLSCLSC